MNSSNKTTIYPARRAIERAVTSPGAQPIRIFGVLIPMWRIEVRAAIQESEPYDVFDQFLTRGIAEANLTTPAALVDFFGVDPSLVDRAVGFLVSLGHVQRNGDTLTLTALGQRSARDGVRYLARVDHRHLYFDGYSGEPMPISHYAGVTYLPGLQFKGRDGTHFRAVGTHIQFNPDRVGALLNRPDRRNFNIPDGLQHAEVHAAQQEWLPAYLIQDAGPIGLQVFSMAAEDRDTHLESRCAHLVDALREEDDRQEPSKLWRGWLDKRGYPNVVPQQLANGVMRAVLPADAFSIDGKFSLYQLGSFEPYQRAFLQLWCLDKALRREAVLDRVRIMAVMRRIRTRAELTEQLDRYAALLEMPVPTVGAFVTYAREHGDAVASSVFETPG